MNYTDLSPETRKAWIETCEKILAQNCEDCKSTICDNCPAYNGRNCCAEGHFHDNEKTRAYFERTLQELKAMETKMTKEEAKKRQDILMGYIKNAEGRMGVEAAQIKVYKKDIAEYQAIIDAPEPDPRVGKLFVFENIDGKVYFELEEIIDRNGRTLMVPKYKNDKTLVGRLIESCRPVTRAEMEAMLYEPWNNQSCLDCTKLKEACDHCEFVPR